MGGPGSGRRRRSVDGSIGQQAAVREAGGLPDLVGPVLERERARQQEELLRAARGDREALRLVGADGEFAGEPGGADDDGGVPVLDLSRVEDAALISADTTELSRANYVLSLLAYRAAITTPARTFAERAVLGKLGLAYLRHVENSAFLQLQMRRTASDDQLKAEITRMKKEMIEAARKVQPRAPDA